MQVKRKTLHVWSIFLIPLSLLTMGASSCSNIPPAWDAKFWAGSSKDKAIVRSQANDKIQCTDARFDNYICVTTEDLLKLQTDVLSKCEKWDTGEPNTPLSLPHDPTKPLGGR